MATSPDVPGAEPLASDDALGEGSPTASVALSDEAGTSPHGDSAPPPTRFICAAGELQHTPGGGVADPTPLHLPGCYNCGTQFAVGRPAQHSRSMFLTTEFLATWHLCLSRASAANTTWNVCNGPDRSRNPARTLQGFLAPEGGNQC